MFGIKPQCLSIISPYFQCHGVEIIPAGHDHRLKHLASDAVSLCQGINRYKGYVKLLGFDILIVSGKADNLVALFDYNKGGVSIQFTVVCRQIYGFRNGGG